MSFVEGMIFCFIGGWINSYLYSNYLRKKNKGWLFYFAILFIGSITIMDLLIYYNIFDIRLLLWAPWIEIPEGVNVGRYYMWNPGLLFGIQFESQIIPGTGLVWEIFAIFFFISYIWWFTIGQNLGRFMYGRLEYEKGAWYLLRTTKMIKRSKEKLEKQQQKVT
ncbi:MAG: hypothetical protein ACTSQJ_09130 [Promethearchaeota archaeon]